MTDGEVTNAVLESLMPTDTANGSIASFPDGQSVFPLKSLVAEINPIQDLHGYDKPWPSGGGANKWDKSNARVGYVNNNTGAINTNSSYKNTDYVEVVPNASYYIKTEQTDSAWGAWYDEDKTYISGVTSYSNGVITAPANAKYVCLTVLSGTSGNIDSFCINYPSTVTTYSPYSNICPISGTDEVGVVDCGANLFDKSKATDGKYYQLSGGNINELPNAPYGHSALIPVKPSTSYCMTGYAGSGYYSIIALDENKKPITTWYGAASKTANFVATTPNNAKYCYLNYLLTQKDTLSLYESTTVGDYIAYNGHTYTVTLPSTVYGGTLDVVSGVLTVTHGIVDLGDLNWDYSSGIFINYTSNIDLHTKERGGYMLSDRYTKSGTASASNMANYSVQVMGGASASNFWVKNPDYTDKNTFKTAMSGAKVVYELADAYKQTIQLTASQINTLKGTNNIFSTNGDVSVEYVADIQGYIDKQL